VNFRKFSDYLLSKASYTSGRKPMFAEFMGR